jgi:hypothetical protein
MTRLAWALAALLVSDPAVQCADAVRIAEVGVKGYYYVGSPTRIRVLVFRSDSDLAIIQLKLRLHTAIPGTEIETIDAFAEPVTLAPNEHRIVDVPVFIRPFCPPTQSQEIEVQETDDQGKLLSDDRRKLDSPLAENLMALLCSKAETCHAAQQTEKGKAIKFVTIEDPPERWWEYWPVKTVVLVRQVWEMTPAQREAVECYAIPA